MNILYAPWRSEYSDSQVRTKSSDATPKECVFCEQTASRDPKQMKQYHIVWFGQQCALMMNKYPYNAGHMLAVPVAHKAELHELDDAERNELFSAISRAAQAVRETLKAEGVNIGMNLGKAGGAGIPAHLHVHIIPRWSGDTNFMATTAQTKVISYDMHEIYQRLVQWFS